MRISWPLLVLTYLLTRLPFVYRGGFPDGDQQHIALGVLDAIRRETFFSGEHLYGLPFSFGYYALHFLLAPLYRRDPQAIFLSMNLLGLAAGLLTLLALHDLLKRAWGAPAALGGAIVLLFLPGWWELTTYGHPSTLGAAMLTTSLAAAYRASTTKVPSAARAWLAGAWILFVSTLTLRADLMLGAPLFLLVLGPGSATWPRRLLRATAFTAFALLVFFLLKAAVGQGGGAAGAQSFVDRALIVRSGSLRVLVKEMAVWILGVGPILWLAAMAALARAVWRRDAVPASVALLGWIIPLGWWLQVEGPFRHLLVPALAGTALVASLFRGMRARRVVGVALALVVANQVVLALLAPPIVDRWSWSYPSPPGVRRWSTRVPLGDWLGNHRAASAAVDAEAAEARWLATRGADSLRVVSASTYRAQFEIIARSRTHVFDRSREPPGLPRVVLSTDAGQWIFLSADPAPTRRLLRDELARSGPRATFYLAPRFDPLWSADEADRRELEALLAGTRRLHSPASFESRTNPREP